MGELSVVTLNTYLCRVFGRDLCPQPDRRARLIRDELPHADADLICLQEVWDDQLSALVTSALRGYQIVQAPATSWRTPMGAGLVIATRLPVREVIFRPICSTLRPKEMLAQRGLLVVLVQYESTLVAVATTHLGRGLPWLRRRQHQAFLATLNPLDQPMILCGDFNVATRRADRRRFSTPVEMERRGFRDVLAEFHGLGAEEMPTVDRVNPLVRRGDNRRVDYIWVRSAAGLDWQVRDASLAFNTPVDGLYVSDHYGLAARLALIR